MSENSIILTPGNGGKDCLGNGLHYDEDGKLIECQCDECDHLITCLTPVIKKRHSDGDKD